MFNLVRETWQLKGRTFQSKRKFASWVQNWKNSFSYRVWWRRHLNLLCILISGVSWPLVAVACFCRHVSRRLFSIIDYFILLASQNANAINMTSSLAELICNLNWSTRHTAQHTAHGTQHTAGSMYDMKMHRVDNLLHVEFFSLIAGRVQQGCPWYVTQWQDHFRSAPLSHLYSRTPRVSCPLGRVF